MILLFSNTCNVLWEALQLHMHLTNELMHDKMIWALQEVKPGDLPTLMSSLSTGRNLRP